MKGKSKRALSQVSEQQKKRWCYALSLPLTLTLMQIPVVFAQPVPLPHQNPGVPLTIGASASAPSHSATSSATVSVPTANSIITASIAANLSKIVNPQQTVIDVGSLQNGVYTFNGNLINTNNLVLVSTNPTIHTGTINVLGGLFNAAGASITTLVPSGYANAVTNLNLVLIASTGIYNAGNITSAGSLTMTSPVIANVLPAGGNPITPVVTALNGDVTLQSNLILNQGTISSTLANVQVSSLTNNLSINALGGIFSAPNGVMNIGVQNITDNLNLQILGGDFLSKALNINAGSNGIVAVEANQIQGTLGITSQDASVAVNTGDLTFGKLLIGGDPYMLDGNGNAVFTDTTDVGYLQVVVTGTITDQGATSILSTNGIRLIGASVDLTGVGNISSGNGPSGTFPEDVYIVATAGAVTIPGVHVSSNGGVISIVANQNVNLAANSGPVIDSSASGGAAGGAIFIASQSGSVNLGSNSIVTTGALAPQTKNGHYAIAVGASGGVSIGDLSAPGGDIAVSSGVNTFGTYTTGWTINNQSRSGGSGGITAGSLNSQLDGKGSDVGNLIYVNATDGSANLTKVQGNGGNIYVLATDSITIQQGVTNTSNTVSGGAVFVAAANSLAIPNGVSNNNNGGAGGIVSLSGGNLFGMTVGNGSGELFVTQNAATDGGTIQVSNTNGPLTFKTNGIVAVNQAGNGTSVELDANGITLVGNLTAGNASANGNGGLLTMSSNGDINLQNYTISSNGSGTGSGGYMQLQASNNLSANHTTITANGGAAGMGGNINLIGSSYSGGFFNVSANGGIGGDGGSVAMFLSKGATISKGDFAFSATGVNGGTVNIISNQDLVVPSANFNVAPYAASNGNGGNIMLTSNFGLLTVVGNIHADGAGTGNGGSINLTSGGSDYAVGNGGTKLFAQSGTTGGSGGQITVAAGNNLTIAPDAVLNTSVRGTNGNGGNIVLQGGLSGVGGVTINGDIGTNGKGTGNGGSINIQGEAFGNAASLNLNGNLAANSGNSGSRGGNINISLFGDSATGLNINGNIHADGNNLANGGNINITAIGFTNSLTVPSPANGATLSVNGGANGGAGGRIILTSDGVLNVGDATINANAKAADNGGIINIVSGTSITSLGRLSVNSATGAGGNVQIISGGDIILNGGFVHASGAQSGNVVLEAGTGVQFGSTSSGNLMINAAIKADGTIASTGAINLSTATASNGNITLNADVSTKGGTLNITADGSGGIQQPSGTLAADKLNLTSTTGNIGLSTARITTSAGMVGGNTGGGGSIYLSLTKDATLLSSSAGITLDVEGSRGITTSGGQKGQNVFVDSKASPGIIVNSNIVAEKEIDLLAEHGDITLESGSLETTSVLGTLSMIGDNIVNSFAPGSSVTIAVPAVSLSAVHGSIGSASSPVILTNPAINASVPLPLTTGMSASGDIFVLVRGDIDVAQHSGAGGLFSLGTLQSGNELGNVTVSSSLTAANISIVTNQSTDSSVLLSGALVNIVAKTSILIQAGGAGNIQQTLPLPFPKLDSPKITLITGTGYIGQNISILLPEEAPFQPPPTNVFPLTVATRDLTVQTGGTLVPNTYPGSVNILNLGTGTMTLENSQAGDSFTLASASKVLVNSVSSFGDVVLVSKSGMEVLGQSQIFSGQGSILLGSAADRLVIHGGANIGAYNGNVYVVNLTGPIVIGAANAPTTFISALNSLDPNPGLGNLVIQTGTPLAANQLSVAKSIRNFNVTSLPTAGYVLWNSSVRVQAPNGGNSATALNRFIILSRTNPVTPAISLEGNVALQAAGQGGAATPTPPAIPLSLMNVFSEISFTESLHPKSVWRGTQLSSADMMVRGNSTIFETKNGFEVQRGEVLISSRKDTSVKIKEVTLVLKAGAIVLITATDGSIVVRNLADSKAHSMRFVIGDSKQGELYPGQEFVWTRAGVTAVAHDKKYVVPLRRCTTRILQDNSTLTMSEFSIPSLISSAHLRDMEKGELLCHAFDKIMKTGAALSLATGAHGNYQNP
ncbi:MAG: DUF4097 domain-containing protein [Candidatus Obscuribacterales bacterium]|nr:DUF4097 domain-containing protein [Candidatus Obscuribacterales bacterium]